MRNLQRLTVCFVLAVVAGCAGEPRPTTPEFTTSDSTAVRASADKWVSTLLAKDFDGWGTTVSSDVVLYPPNSKPVMGRDAGIAFTRSYPPIEQFSINVDELVGRGDVAYDRGTYRTTVKLPNGTQMSDSGSFFSVFRRQPDGGWQHSRVMWTTYTPVPTPPAPPARRTR